MNNKKLENAIFCIIIIFIAYISIDYIITPPDLISRPILITHAGGGIKNLTYTNSLEALNFNYEEGHRFFEIDISFTSDNRLVLIHDWGDHMRECLRMFLDGQLMKNLKL